MKVVNVSEAAILLRVSAAQIRRAINEGELETIVENPTQLDLREAIAWRLRTHRPRIEKAVIG